MYSIEQFDRPSVAADAVVFGFDTEKAEPLRGLKQRRLKLLLVRRGEEPFCGRCSLPGGFLRRGETVEQAALRELSEETGVADPKLMQLGVYSETGRDPRGWIISCAFLALTKTVTPVPARVTIYAVCILPGSLRIVSFKGAKSDRGGSGRAGQSSYMRRNEPP